jgi:hypothetical protein
MVDMLSGTVATNKADCLDCRMIRNGIYGWDLAVNNVEDTVREA